MKKPELDQYHAISRPKSKSRTAAVALNVLLPGAGYLYMGRWFAGIFGGALILAILVRSPQEHLFLVWIVTNLIMAIDMCLLNSNRQSKKKDFQ
ncbi:hypothetical protein SAMN05421862_11580 [Pseudomonas extremaustralis]|uniref:hypothetical protein n=1 Tax=Pseudomonas TaxID=286 RepID=UPI00099D8E8E|nr:hypothetical protein [Pseudomonas extremaustralis]SKB00364.1 hypothetical protein SAMN05421862_11580 [Pseudomonas extremaustralis]